MHPFLRSPGQFLLMGLFWSPIVFFIILLQSSLGSIPLSKAAVLIGPIMVIQLFFSLSIWYPCKALSRDKYKITSITFYHTLSGVLMTLLWLALAALYSKILDYFTKSQTWYEHFSRSIPLLAAVGVFLYFMVCLIYYLYLAFEKRREAEQMALENHLLASKAELNSLKASVHPHFLFNSLTALSALIRTSPDRAQRMCLQISDFLRYSLSYGQQDWVKVKNEIEHINNYLEIEKVRMGDRLKMDFQAEKNTADVKIPPFSLLPLVENAVKHALQQTLDSFTLTIRIKKAQDTLFIVVKNPYEKTHQISPRGGFGLKGLKKRLLKTYGDDALLTITKGKTDFTVKLQLPIKGKKKDE